MSPEVAVIGSLIAVVALLGVGALAARLFMESSREGSQLAQRVSPNEPVELTCGIRRGWLNSTGPFGRMRVDESGLSFAGVGIRLSVPWANVSLVELVKPMNLIGWGVRFTFTPRAPCVIAWIMSGRLVTEVITACGAHGAPVAPKWRFVL